MNNALQVEAVADALGARWRAMVFLAAYSSLRWWELVELRLDRLDLPPSSGARGGEAR